MTRLIRPAPGKWRFLVVLAAVSLSTKTYLAQTPVPGAVSSSPPAPSAAQRSNPPGAQRASTAVIRGRVFAADTGVPIRRAQIRLTAEGATGAGILVGSDDEGRYEYSSLVPG